MSLPQSPHRFAFVLGASCFVAAILVAGSQISARAADEKNAPATAAVAQPPSAARKTNSFLAGIPQRGDALGRRTARVTVVEYADLQCPYCAQWARETLPVVVNRYVRTGKVRLVFRGLAFIGPDSQKALGTAVAAGQDNHLWDVVHALYERQGGENTGWVTDDLVSEIAAGLPGVSGAKLLDKRSAPSVEQEIQRAAAAAQADGVSGTPTFQVGPTGGPLELVQLRSLGPEGIAPAIQAVLDE